MPQLCKHSQGIGHPKQQPNDQAFNHTTRSAKLHGYCRGVLRNHRQRRFGRIIPLRSRLPMLPSRRNHRRNTTNHAGRSRIRRYAPNIYKPARNRQSRRREEELTSEATYTRHDFGIRTNASSCESISYSIKQNINKPLGVMRMNNYSYYTDSGVGRSEWATSYGGPGGCKNNPLQIKKRHILTFADGCNLYHIVTFSHNTLIHNELQHNKHE